jgi:hypothetical protein
MLEKQQRNGFAGRLRSLFNGRSTISSQVPPLSVVSPKSPAPRLGLSILSSPTIDIPGLPSHRSPSSRSPTSRHSVNGVRSPTGVTIAAPPSSRSRRSPALPPSPPLPQSGRSSPRTNWEWEHVRDNSGHTRRRRRRARTNGRPRSNKKSLLRQKAGRMKLFRCLGLGLVLAIGLTVCKLARVSHKS